MTSEAKLLANRKNASKSTGPKSEEGKARSARNSTKHGAYAQNPYTPDDEVRDYRAWLENWHEEYQPAGPGEVALLEQAAQAAWKLRQFAKVQEAAEAKRVRHAASRFEREERERAERLGKRLLAPAFASAQNRRTGSKPKTSECPPALKRELESFAQGADWLLDWWRKLRATLAVDGRWDDFEVFVSIALLGRYADECLDDPELTEVCIAAQATFGPVWNLSLIFTQVGALQEQRMTAQERVLTFNNSPLTDPVAAVAFLNAFVTRQIDRLTALKSEELDDLAALDRDEAIARAHFDATPTGAALRRSEAACAAEFHRSLRALEKLQSTPRRNEANAEPLIEQEVVSEPPSNIAPLCEPSPVAAAPLETVSTPAEPDSETEAPDAPASPMTPDELRNEPAIDVQPSVEVVSHHLVEAGVRDDLSGSNRAPSRPTAAPERRFQRIGEPILTQ